MFKYDTLVIRHFAPATFISAPVMIPPSTKRQSEGKQCFGFGVGFKIRIALGLGLRLKL